MTKHLPAALVAAFFVVLSGCSAVSVWDAGKDRVADRAADVVADYCERYDAEEREVLRERMGERTDPHVIRVECAE